MHIFYANVEFLEDSQTFDTFLPFVSSERQKSALNYKHRKDKARSLGAGLLLNYAISKYFPQVPQPVQLEFLPQKKPVIKDYSSICANLSHAGIYAACAVGSSDIGIDIERVRKVSDALMNKCCTQEELAFLARFEETEQKKQFCRIWTRKESYIKATGEGLLIDLSLVNVIAADGFIYKNGQKTSFYCQTFDQIEDYFLSICEKKTNADFLPADFAQTVQKTDLYKAFSANIQPGAKK